MKATIRLAALLTGVFMIWNCAYAQDITEKQNEYSFLEKEFAVLYRDNIDSAITFFYHISGEDSAEASAVGRYLIVELQKANEDSLYIEIAYELGQAMLTWGDFDGARQYFDGLVGYAQGKNLPQGISYGYKGLGDWAQEQSHFTEAIGYFSLAERGWKETNNYQKLGYLYNNIGVCYRKQGDNYRALKFYIDAVELLKKVDDPRALAYISNNIGNIYFDQNELDQALEYYQLVLVSGQKINDQRLIATAYNNVGLIYDKMGDQQLALSYFRRALAMSYLAKVNESIILSLTNLGESLTGHEQYDSAIYYLQSALDMSRELDDTESEVFALIGLGEVSKVLGDFTNARVYLSRGLTLSEEAHQGANIVKASQNLALVEEKLGNYREALAYERKAHSVADSLKQIEISNNLALLQAEYQFKVEQGKSEAQIQALTSENQIQELQLSRRNLALLVVIILTIAVLTVGFLINRGRTVKRMKEANDLKQKLLRVQLNPHFMFNSLNAIQNMIFRSVDKHRTADYLARFSHLTRQILELNRRDFITLKDELKFIENYLSIQQIRFDEPFGYTISIDDEVEADSTMIPPMITQPFLENAIEHGIINKKDQGEIKLIVTTDDTHLYLKIEDNGVGREKAAFAKKVESHRSLATEITQDRLANLAKSFRKEAFMRIEDIFDGELVCGTRVHFTLPLNFMNT